MPTVSPNQERMNRKGRLEKAKGDLNSELPVHTQPLPSKKNRRPTRTQRGYPPPAASHKRPRPEHGAPIECRFLAFGKRGAQR